MGAKGYVVSEQAHVVNILPPVDVTGGVVAQAFSMKEHHHASILLQIGVSAAAFTKILLNACTKADGTGPTPLPFAIYAQETAGADKDVLTIPGGTNTPRQQIGAAGYAPSANNGIFYTIELDAAELPDGSPYVQLQLTNTSNSVIASAVAILTGSRFAGAKSTTATA